MSGEDPDIRPFQPDDEAELNRVSAAAFAEYEDHIPDETWAWMYFEWSRMSSLGKSGEIFVGLDQGQIVGGVCYVGPQATKPPWCNPDWAAIRSLAADPSFRGRGLGARLVLRCLEAAQKDQAPCVGLKTTPFMSSGIRLYHRLGFEKGRDLDDTGDIAWQVYYKRI